MIVLNTLSVCIGSIGVAIAIFFIVIVGDSGNTTNNIELLQQIRVYAVAMTFILIGLFGYVTTKQ